MQFIRVVAAPEFKAAGLVVRFAVRQPFCHAVAFVQLMQQHKPPFLLLYIVVNPDLVLRNEFINVVMTSGGEINIEYTSHQPVIDNPYAYTILQFLP